MTGRPWTGPIAFEGLATIDGRYIDHGALSWECPLPLYVIGTRSGHDHYDMPSPSGVIHHVERRDAGQMFAVGWLDRPLPSRWRYAAVDAHLADAYTEGGEHGLLRIRSAVLAAVWLHAEPQAWPAAIMKRGPL